MSEERGYNESDGLDRKSTEEDYNKFIADAARAYRQARNAGDQQEEARAYDTLCWMLDAKTHGWEPSNYVPEWEEQLIADESEE